MSILVADLIEEIQDRIPEEKFSLLFPVLSRAIDIISKRLYLMDSDLIIGSLAVRVFAKREYEAGTIALVPGATGSAGTITDSAAQFLTAGFAAGMPIETSIVSGPLQIASVTADTITLALNDTITAASAGSAVKISALPSFGYLPYDFNGLIGPINIDGLKRTLPPLPSRDVELTYSGAGSPLFYKLRGNQLHVVPQTRADIVIVGDYYKRPLAITHMNQYVPFYGTMDSVIQEVMVRVLNAGAASITPEVYAEMESYLETEINLYAGKRQRKAPAPLPGGINW